MECRLEEQRQDGDEPMSARLDAGASNGLSSTAYRTIHEDGQADLMNSPD
jgi:hypothetical protein